MFSPVGTYPSAEMFSGSHILLTAVCLSATAVFYCLCRNLSIASLRKLIRGVAFAVTPAEVGKIAFRFGIDKIAVTDTDKWLPLYYCSLFIYYAWCASSKCEVLQTAGDTFLSVGGVTGGFAYLCFPTTSLTLLPAFHIMTFHAFLYHSLMIFTGLLCLCKGLFRPSVKSFAVYTLTFLIFALPAILINGACGGNMMMLSRPYSLPSLVTRLYEVSDTLYTALVTVTYILVPYGFSSCLYFLFNRRGKKKRKNAGQPA